MGSGRVRDSLGMGLLAVLLRCMEEVKIYYFSKRGIQEVIKFIFAKKCEIGTGRGNIS